jgi:hypothetical protein
MELTGITVIGARLASGSSAQHNLKTAFSGVLCLDNKCGDYLPRAHNVESRVSRSRSISKACNDVFLNGKLSQIRSREETVSDRKMPGLLKNIFLAVDNIIREG